MLYPIPFNAVVHRSGRCIAVHFAAEWTIVRVRYNEVLYSNELWFATAVAATANNNDDEWDDDDVVLPKFAATPNIPVAPVVAATTIPGGRGVFAEVRTRSFGPVATMTVDDALFRIPDDDPDDGNGRRVVESVAKVEMEKGGVVDR